MIKKLLIGFGATTAVFTLLAVAAVVIGSGGEAQPPPKPAPKASKPSVWDGGCPRAGEQPSPVCRQVIGARFVRGDATGANSTAVKVDAISYRGLHTNATNMTIELLIPATSSGSAPKWVKRENFRLRSVGDNRAWDLKGDAFTAKPAGGNIKIVLRYKKMSTKRLAAVYRQSRRHQALQLWMLTPTGAISYVIAPPAPPAGHEYAESGKGRPNRGRSLNREDELLARVGRALGRGDEDPRVVKRRAAREQARSTAQRRRR
jgi:hypothetical protein